MSSRASKFAAVVFGVAICVGSVAQLRAQEQEQERGQRAKPDVATVTESLLYTFCSENGCDDGNGPAASLAQGADGNFYGVAYGGTNQGGVAYKITPNGAYTLLHAFCADTSCTDGTQPAANLVQGSDGNFYGTTSGGGANVGSGNCAGTGFCGGTVYKVTPAGAWTLVYSFCSKAGCADGSQPVSTGLVQGTDGNFYGTTQEGGNYQSNCNCTNGTVFKITPAGVLTTLHSFCSVNSCPDGQFPEPGLVQGSDGNFYGTTNAGGANSDGTGTVFKITPGGSLTTLYSFCSEGTVGCSNGSFAGPAPLVEGSDGNYYGTTGEGGSTAGGISTGAGTIYKITSGGTLTSIYSFCSVSGCPDGETPAELFLGSDGNFYGTTELGGANNQGTAFVVTSGGSLTTLYSFCSLGSCADSEQPKAGLLQASDGNFYGTASNGTEKNAGVAYRLALSPALAAPVQLTLSQTAIETGTEVTLSWRVLNAFSDTMQQCVAFVQGGATGAGTWTGKQTGTLSDGVYAGSATITPTADGLYTYALTCGGQESGYATLTVGVAITTTELPTGSVGIAYAGTMSAQGGTSPYTWSVSSGSLPAGLTLNASTGAISGKPTTAATTSFTIEVMDSASHSATQALSITVFGSTILRITTTSLPSATIGTAYSATLAATSGTKPYTWSIVQGSLPVGLSIAASTGVISGTPTSVGTSSFLVGVKGAGANTATAQLSITVNPTLMVDTTLLPTAAVGTAYSFTLTASYGTSPYTWSVSSGSMPAGLTLNASTGVISGTPTTAVTADAFTVEVTDSASHTATQALSMTVYIANIVRITTKTLPSGTVGTAYSATLAATSGTKPYTWSVYSGSLPAGLSLAASTGVISGTPTTAGTSDFFIGVKGAGANTATASLGITVAQ